jgi:uncharacterized OB-fold protein
MTEAGEKGEAVEPSGFPAAPTEGLAGEFFAGQAQGELRMQRCAGCGRWRHPPTETCPDCWSRDLRWERCAGSGTVFSWTRTHHAFVPGLAGMLPYVCVVVELDEGPRMLSGLRLDRPDDPVEVGQRVMVRFEARAGGGPVAVFGPLVGSPHADIH